MRDPIRWREADGGADPEVRALLANDRGPVPSSEEASSVWSGLQSRLDLAPGSPEAPPVGPAAKAAGGLAGKIALAVVLVAGVGAGVHGIRSLQREKAAPGGQRTAYVAIPKNAPSASVREPSAAAPRPEPLPTPSIVARAAPAPRVRAAKSRPVERVASLAPSARPAGAPAPSEGARIEARAKPDTRAEDRSLPSSWGPSPLPAPTPAHAHEGTVSSPRSASLEAQPSLTNDLLHESRRLARARAALRAHDPDRALELLEKGTPRTAALAQEREALTIEALAAKPEHRALASERALAFMRAYPQSPYRARVRALVLEGK